MPYVTIRKADSKANQEYVANFSETEDSNTYGHSYFNKLCKSELSGQYIWGKANGSIVFTVHNAAFDEDIDQVIKRVKNDEVVPLDVSN